MKVSQPQTASSGFFRTVGRHVCGHPRGLKGASGRCSEPRASCGAASARAHVCPGLTSTLRDQTMSHPALHDALADPKNGDSATKHLKQQVRPLVSRELTFCSSSMELQRHFTQAFSPGAESFHFQNMYKPVLKMLA